MMPLNLFHLQLMETYANVRQTITRIAVSILLSLPFIFVSMPPGAKASGLVMVILFTAFFGSAIAHARLCEDGRFSKLCLLPTPRPVLWLDLILASTVSRVLPTMIIVGGFILFNSPTLKTAGIIQSVALMCETIALLVVLGTLTGHLCRSHGQVHLFSALVCAMIAFLSGVTPGVDKIQWLTPPLSFNPLHQLLDSLSVIQSGTLSVSASEWTVSLVILSLVALLVLLRLTSGGQWLYKKIIDE